MADKSILTVVCIGCLCLSPVLAEEAYIGPARSIQGSPTNRVAEVGSEQALTVYNAILAALENNRNLQVQRLTPSIRQTYEQQERAAFDPTLNGQAAYQKNNIRRQVTDSNEYQEVDTEERSGELSIDEFLPTGTRLSVGGSTDNQDVSLYNDRFVGSRAGLSVTQSLLQGMGMGVNLASLRQARLDTLMSAYELRGIVEALVADVERTYWDYALAQRQIAIYEDSLKVAEQQRMETQERIRVGKLAETELAAAEAEVALRQEGLINARSDLEQARLRLLRLVNPPGSNLWNRVVTLADQPAAPEGVLDDVESHAQVALKWRPDLNQARLSVRRGELEVVKTRNGLLPKLDVFVTLGRTGYADSFQSSVRDINDDGYDSTVGLQFAFPPANRDARARHRRAVLSRAQSEEAVENLVQLIQVDVRSAFVEVNRSREQVLATTATRKKQEEAWKAEVEKFRVGKSTSLLVVQAERNLLESQIMEIRSVINLLKAYVSLYRLEGSLLERRGIEAPGREPVEAANQNAQ